MKLLLDKLGLSNVKTAIKTSIGNYILKKIKSKHFALNAPFKVISFCTSIRLQMLPLGLVLSLEHNHHQVHISIELAQGENIELKGRLGQPDPLRITCDDR